MNPVQAIFKRKKSPDQLVKLLSEALENYLKVYAPAPAPPATDAPAAPPAPPSARQVAQKEHGEEITKRLHQIKTLLYGEADSESNPQKCAQLATLIVNARLIEKLVIDLSKLPFESRKHVAQIYNNLIRRDLGNFVQYVGKHPQILILLINGYSMSEIALSSGSMLRESLRHEALTRIVLESSEFWQFFDVYVHLPNFDVASDAFASFKDALTRHKNLTTAYFDVNFDKVFEKYNGLLQSENYVTRRQSLKLLGEVLLDRTNFNTMMRYISKRENLKMMMNLLRDKSANIQFEAFHVFKVFVANPKKPDEITQILINNREKLISYLQKFQNEKEDEQFSDEKALLIKTLTNLELAKATTQEAQTTSAST